MARFAPTAALTCLLVALAAAGEADPGDRLASPVKLTAGGPPIDVTVGHAAPVLFDLDGDGARDLLVGQFGGGKLRFYRNIGTEAAPEYGHFEYVTAGGSEAKVPSG
jgi:hypothetical protein